MIIIYLALVFVGLFFACAMDVTPCYTEQFDDGSLDWQALDKEMGEIVSRETIFTDVYTDPKYWVDLYESLQSYSHVVLTTTAKGHSHAKIYNWDKSEYRGATFVPSIGSREYLRDKLGYMVFYTDRRLASTQDTDKTARLATKVADVQSMIATRNA